MWQGPDATGVYVWGEEDVLRSYEFKNGKLITPPAKSLYHAPPGMPGAMISISADGNKAGAGIVWALLPYAGGANQERGVQAQLLAFDAQDIKNDIFRSSPLMIRQDRTLSDCSRNSLLRPSRTRRYSLPRTAITKTRRVRNGTSRETDRRSTVSRRIFMSPFTA
jgi:hypothetical protein